MNSSDEGYNIFDVAEKGRWFLVKYWFITFVFSVILLFHPILGKYFQSLFVPLNLNLIIFYKNLFFILLVVLVIAVFFIKRTWLSYFLINNFIKKGNDFKKTWGLPIPVFKGEPVFGNGVLYHVRKTMLLIYVTIFLSVVICELYYNLTGDKGNIYVYGIILLFSTILNYPRKRIITNIINLIQEESYDQEQSMG